MSDDADAKIMNGAALTMESADNGQDGYSPDGSLPPENNGNNGEGEPPPPFAVKEDFKPFYEKEAKAEARSGVLAAVILYSLLFALAAALLVLAGEVLFSGVGFKHALETTVVVAACLALVIVLRKSISLEARVGLEAATVGLVVLRPELSALYIPGTLPVWTLTGDLIWPVFFLLALVAILAGTWLLWARRFWLAAMLSLVVVFAAAGPVCSLMYGDTRLSEVLLCSAVFYQWPVYLRPGYIMAQVVLPLGIFLMIVLQIRALARKYHKIHAGYFFWAIFLLCAAVIGLMSLEGQAQPVFPSMRQMAGKIAPLPEQTLSDAGTAAPESRDLEPAEPGTDDESALVEPEPDQGDPESRIEALEREIEELKAQLNAQEEIISDLKLRLEGEDGAESPDEPGEEASPDEPEPSPEEKPVITRGGRRI